MGDNLLKPISDEQAKAIQETAKLGSKGLETLEKGGAWLAGIVGTLPHDFVGLAMGDWLAHTRIKRLADLQEETRAHLERRGVKEPFADVSPSVAVPLIQAAVDETREELRDLWSRLLAAAMDPDRKDRVRTSLFDKLKQLDPLDVAVLKVLHEREDRQPSVKTYLRKHLGRTSDEIEVSLQNLIDLGLISGAIQTPYRHNLSATGNVFMRAVAD